MKKMIKVGSRESKLAMAQTNWVINEIKKKHPQLEFEIMGIKTKGDIILDTRLDKIGGKGLFIKELEQALISGAIDMAVHSMKDMPAEIPDELEISAVSKREDPRDVFVACGCKTFEELPEGSTVGTSSARREAQLLRLRPDLKIKTLRGNVLTRINKLVCNEYDALILAAAGLKRLGLEERCTQYFDIDKMIPAVGQGALAVETRRGWESGFLTDSIHCDETALTVSAERAFLIKLNGGCSIPIAAHAVIDGDRMKVWGLLASEDKSRIYREQVVGSKLDAAQLGEKLAALIVDQCI